SRFSVTQSETQLFWVGNSQEGQLGIWMMENFKVTEVTTPFIRKLLSSPDFDANNFRAFILRHSGRKFYIIQLGTSTSLAVQVWAYDLEEKFWYQWDFGTMNTYLGRGADINTGESLLVSNTGLLALDSNIYQDLGQTITCQWTTDPIDFDSFNRKAAHRLAIY